MKNLYERLKPEILEDIQKDLKKYPATTKDLINTLKSTHCWTDLTVHEVNRIITFSHTNLLSISHMDLLHGDKFLLKEDDDYILSITG